VAYFYFDFKDTKKQNPQEFLRSVIVQISAEFPARPEALETLYSQSQDGQRQPTRDALMSTLRDMLGNLEETFIIVDALDECDNREELLEILNELTTWEPQQLHILTTSRREKDIEEVLGPLTSQICIQNAIVNADIRLYIRNTIHGTSWRKWSQEVRNEVEVELMANADGM
jgi:ankyrin repeat domain-containing protein 50